MVLETELDSTSTTLSVSGGGGSWFDQFGQAILDFIAPFPVELGVRVSTRNPAPGEVVEIQGVLTGGDPLTSIETAINNLTPDWFPNIGIPSPADVLNWIATNFGFDVGVGIPNKQVTFNVDQGDAKILGEEFGGAIDTTDSRGVASAQVRVNEGAAGQTVRITVASPRQASAIETQAVEASFGLDVGGAAIPGTPTPTPTPTNGDGNGGGNGDGRGLGAFALLGLILVLANRKKDN